MSISVMNQVWVNAQYQGNTLLTLLALADWSNDEGVSWPSVLKLANKSRQSERNCQNCLDKLVKDGILFVTTRPNTSNVYKINLGKLNGCKDFTPEVPAKKSMRGGKRDGKQGAAFAPYTSDTSDTPKKEPSEPSKGGTLLEMPLVFPEWVPLPEWTAFVEMRKAIKKPLTEYAKKLAIGNLEKLRTAGEDPAAVLNQSILKNWQDLYAVKHDERDPKPKEKRVWISEKTGLPV